MELIKRTCQEVCDKKGIDLREIDGEDDHIHLLLAYPPKISLSDLVLTIKTNTAKRVRETDWDEAKKTGTKHFWSPSYFAVSVGGAPLEKVAEYIRNQRKPPRGPGRPRV